MSRSPTPWRAGKTHRLNTPGEAYETPITDADGNAIATVHNADDAKVMALAPELAEALHRLICSVQDNERREWAELKAARAVLAKVQS